MTDSEQKRIFSKNLNNYLSLFDKTQKEVADAIGVSPQTFNTWCQAIALPRMGKVQRLADYFQINKSDLIDEHPAAALPSPASTLTDLDMEVANKFHDADSISKAMVMKALDIDLEDKKEKGIA